MTDQGLDTGPDRSARSKGGRHAAPRRRGRRSWAAVIGVALVVLVVVAVAVWLGRSWTVTVRQAQDVQAQVESLNASLSDSKWGDAIDRLPEASASARALEASTEGVEWRVLAALPVVGSSARAVSEMAVSLTDVMAAAEPLAPVGERLLTGDLQVESGAIDAEFVQAAAPLLARLSTSLDGAGKRLDAFDATGVRPEVAGPLGELRDRLKEVAPGFGAAAGVVSHVPGLLGAGAPRTWLVLVQNPAEARGSGGFVDGYALITADNGRVSVTSTGTAADLAERLIATGAAPADAAAMWGNRLKQWTTFNASPDFALTAKVAAAGMNALGTPVSGVIAVDPVVVAAMLSATGPVSAEGVTVDSSNVDSFLTTDIYRLYDDDVKRKEVSTAVVTAVLRRFFATQWDTRAVVDAMKAPVSQGRVRVWSADPSEEEWLAGTGVGGALPMAPGPIVAVAFNNAAANKVDAFVGTEVHYTPGRCPTSTQQSSSVSVKVRNDAPVDLPDNGEYGRQDNPAAPKGSTNLLVHVYAPIGADLLSATIDGKPASLNLGSEGERPVWWTYLPINRDQQREVAVQFTEPTVLGVEPRVIPQPMVRDEIITITPDPSCRP